VPVVIVPPGVYENSVALHVELVCEAMIAAGLIVTVNVNGVPVQLPVGEVGVTL
jgi:hypothetical protein